MTKSQPLIYEKVSDKLGVSVSECTFFDDNLIALSTAKRAGMRTIRVYDKSSDAFTDEIKRIAHAFIYDFCEISLL